MNLSKLGIIFLFGLFSTLCVGQKCNYSKKMLKQANKQFTDEKILEATKFEMLAKNFTTNVLTHFLKSENNYYLGLTLVRGGRRAYRIDLMEDNPLILSFDNDHVLTLFPHRVVPHVNIGFSQELNVAYYKLSQEELELFASRPIHNLKIYFSSDRDFSSKRNVSTDDLGLFMQFEIEKKDRQTSCIINAQCILN